MNKCDFIAVKFIGVKVNTYYYIFNNYYKTKKDDFFIGNEMKKIYVSSFSYIILTTDAFRFFLPDNSLLND